MSVELQNRAWNSLLARLIILLLGIAVGGVGAFVNFKSDYFVSDYAGAADCILGEIQGNESPAAAKEIRRACNRKHSNYSNSSGSNFLASNVVGFEGSDLVVKFTGGNISRLELRYRTGDCWSDKKEKTFSVRDFTPPLKYKTYQISHAKFKDKVPNFRSLLDEKYQIKNECIRLVKID